MEEINDLENKIKVLENRISKLEKKCEIYDHILENYIKK